MNFWWWLRTCLLAQAAIILGIVATVFVWCLGIFLKEFLETPASREWYRLIIFSIFLGIIPSIAGSIVSAMVASWSISLKTMLPGLLAGVCMMAYALWEMKRHVMGVQGLAWWMLAPFVLPAIISTICGVYARIKNHHSETPEKQALPSHKNTM